LITEEHLNVILKEMDYHICGIAGELDPQKISLEGIRIEDDFLSLKFLREKVALLKHHVDWIRVDMEEDGK